MTDLTPEAAALFEEARAKHDPSDAECARMLDRLHARLGIPAALASAQVLEAATPAAVSAKTGGVGALLATKAGKLVLVSIVVGGTVGATLLGGARPTPQAAAPVVSPPVVEQVAATTLPDAMLEPVTLTPTPTPTLPQPERRSTTHKARAHHGRSHGHVARSTEASEPAPARDVPTEVSLIRRALTSLRDHDPHAALSSLETHATYYPNGLFRKEREGARVLALCAAGRTHDGRKAKADFLADAGSSPIAARVRLACREE